VHGRIHGDPLVAMNPRPSVGVNKHGSVGPPLDGVEVKIVNEEARKVLQVSLVNFLLEVPVS